ncbi:hypothetical protein Esti_005063 [Eimeria stiedai]
MTAGQHRLTGSRGLDWALQNHPPSTAASGAPSSGSGIAGSSGDTTPCRGPLTAVDFTALRRERGLVRKDVGAFAWSVASEGSQLLLTHLPSSQRSMQQQPQRRAASASHHSPLRLAGGGAGLVGPRGPLTMRRHEGGYPLELWEEDDREGLGRAPSSPLIKMRTGGAPSPSPADLQSAACPLQNSHFNEVEAAAVGEGTFSACRGPPQGPPSPFSICIDNAPVCTEWISPVYERLLPRSTDRGWMGPRCSFEGPLQRIEGAEPPEVPPPSGNPGITLAEKGAPDASSAPTAWASSTEIPSSSTVSEAGVAPPSELSSSSCGEEGAPGHLAGERESCCSPQGEEREGLGVEAFESACTSGGEKQEGIPSNGAPTEGPPTGGPRRPCLVLLDLDNTLIPTGWIMACWRKMQLYFGLQQAVACIRKGLEQAELVEALRDLFDDLRALRERRHTQIVIVTNAGLRTVQEFYLKMCLPELKELCEREKVYIHSTEHFARRVGPIPPMTEEEAFCEFYTALKYHEFDFVVQRYLNALLCQAPIPLQGHQQGEEAGAAPPCSPCRSEGPPTGQTEGAPPPARRATAAALFTKRARLSTQRETPAAAAAAAAAEGQGGSSYSTAARCDVCSREAEADTAAAAAESGDDVGGGPPSSQAPCSPLKTEAPAGGVGGPPLQQQTSHSCCCCAAEEAKEKAEKKRGAPLSLREHLQAAAVAACVAAEAGGSSSPAPSPSESPRGFDPFPLDWRCDLISAGDQVCEIHAACRVARHFAGHIKFAKLLFLRDPEDPRFLTQTPTRFIAQLKELHASLLHVSMCDEETLDEQGHPRWVRRGAFSQVTIVAPERLENPPRHCAAARVRHAFEFLRKRRTKNLKGPPGSNTSATTSVRQRQLDSRAGGGPTDGGGEEAAEQTRGVDAPKKHILSCPLEWERNAVANPPTASFGPLRGSEKGTRFGGGVHEAAAPNSGRLATVSESRSV